MNGLAMLAAAALIAADGTNDMSSAVLSAVDRLRGDGGGTVTFAPGEYRFASPRQLPIWVSNHHNPMPRNVFLPVTGVANVGFVSEGARFVCDGEGIALALIDATNVTVRGIAFDYARPYFSEWTLRGGRLSAENGNYPCRVESGKLITHGTGWTAPQRLAEFFDTATRRYLGTKWWDGSAEHVFAGFPDGATAVTRSAYRPNPTVLLYRAANAVFRDCAVHSSAGIGLLAQRCDTVTVDGWRTRDGRRLTALQADATHFSNCRGRITVERGLFEGMLDDAINVHSTCLAIEAIPAPDRIVCRYRHAASVGFEVFLPGETLRFIHAETLESGGEVRVRAVRRLAPDRVELTLARPVPRPYGIGDAVENADWQPSVTFRGNTVRNSNPRAALFTTPGRIVCESNLFENVAGSPIQLAGDTCDWYESGGCRDVLIQGNVFRSCAFAGGRAMVAVEPAVRNLAAQRERYHRNIRIVNNRFEDFAVPLVRGVSASNVVVRGNAIVHGRRDVALDHSEAVSVGAFTGEAADLPDGPEAWLEFIGGNVRKDGLTLDLEAIKAAGFSGVQFFHIGGREVWPGCDEQIPCMSEKWADVIGFLGTECRRLGLRLTVQNCPGWSQSGGPWVAVTNAMRDIRFARLDFAAGAAARVPPVPKAARDADSDWRDVAVLAFPTPRGDGETAEVRPVAVVTNGEDRVYRFAEPVTIRTLALPGLVRFSEPFAYNAPWMSVRLDAMADDGTVTTVLDTELPRYSWRDYVETLSLACDEATAREWRYTFRHRRPIVRWCGPTFLTAARQTDWESKSARVLRSLLHERTPRQDPSAWVKGDAILDLTDRVRADGGLDWKVPPGRWTILRVGHVNKKLVNSPAPGEATGWECDKLAPEGIESHFRGYIGRLLDGPLKGKMRGMLVDSWECFGQTWTPRMERYFAEANGYGLRKRLPALFGWVIDSPEKTERFLTDWRRTVGNLITRNYYGRMAELAHAAGLDVQYETAFGDIVHGDVLEYWKHADAPMCEFWLPHEQERGFVGSYDFKPVQPCASAAHVYGKRRVSAEAFTGWGISWNEDFKAMKDDANRHYARGVTHLAVQSYTHAPAPDALPPGGCMGGNNGTPFTRLQTWWRHMPELTGWFRRCERFLERGQPAQDVLWYLGDAVDHKPDECYPFPEGYRADLLNHDVLTNRLTVADGAFTVPEGASWRVLWVPDERGLLPATENALTALARRGGRVVRGDKTALARTLAKLPKDVATAPALGDGMSEDFMWIHRVEGLKDLYFVAAGTNGWTGAVTFRSSGAVTVRDTVTDAPIAWRNGDRMTLAPSQSLFVEFDRTPGAVAAPLPKPVAGRAVDVALSDWRLDFPNGRTIALPSPASWSSLPQLSREERAFSGTATYETTFALPTAKDGRTARRVELSLGDVATIAEVWLNGRRVRTLWCEPYVCDLSGYAVEGTNRLTVKVTNTWRNRVVYDLGEPVERRKTWILYRPNLNPSPKDPFIPAGLIGPARVTAFEPEHQEGNEEHE